jgi:hypothetical protein
MVVENFSQRGSCRKTQGQGYEERENSLEPGAVKDHRLVTRCELRVKGIPKTPKYLSGEADTVVTPQTARWSQVYHLYVVFSIQSADELRLRSPFTSKPDVLRSALSSYPILKLACCQMETSLSTSIVRVVRRPARRNERGLIRVRRYATPCCSWITHPTSIAFRRDYRATTAVGASPYIPTTQLPLARQAVRCS